MGFRCARRRGGRQEIARTPQMLDVLLILRTLHVLRNRYSAVRSACFRINGITVLYCCESRAYFLKFRVPAVGTITWLLGLDTDFVIGSDLCTVGAVETGSWQDADVAVPYE